jgi:hypothetical protein
MDRIVECLQMLDEQADAIVSEARECLTETIYEAIGSISTLND